MKLLTEADIKTMICAALSEKFSWEEHQMCFSQGGGVVIVKNILPDDDGTRQKFYVYVRLEEGPCMEDQP